MKAYFHSTSAVIASISLLALVGCSDAGSNGEDTGTGEEAANEEAAPGVEDVPALSDVEDLMWNSMEEAGSVTMIADMQDIAEFDEQGAEAFQQMLGSEGSEFKIYGELDGSASAVSVNDSDVIATFGGEEAYVSADVMFGLLGTQDMGLSAGEQEIVEQMSDEFSGKWLDFSEEIQSTEDDQFDVGSMFAELRDGWADEEDSSESSDSSDSPVEREEISDEGTHEVRDDADVWVYGGEDEGQELVLTADHEAPKIVEVSDGEMTMALTDWGETQTPEQPDESDLMTEQDIQQAIVESMMGGGSGSGDADSGE